MLNIGNIIKSPDEPKFQNINLENPNFKARVVDIVGGVFILEKVGFANENQHLVLQKKDLNLIKETVQALEKEIASLP